MQSSHLAGKGKTRKHCKLIQQNSETAMDKGGYDMQQMHKLCSYSSVDKGHICTRKSLLICSNSFTVIKVQVKENTQENQML